MPTIAEKWEQAAFEKGELIGSIRSLQEALAENVRSREELLELEVRALQRILDDLRQQLHSRR